MMMINILDSGKIIRNKTHAVYEWNYEKFMNKNTATAESICIRTRFIIAALLGCWGIFERTDCP